MNGESWRERRRARLRDDPTEAERTACLLTELGIEIARRPDLSARHNRAKSELEHEDPVVAQEALRELSTVLDETMRAVRV